MSAKKSDFGLIIKLLVALAIGAFLGRMANVEVMDAVASVKYALGQIIFYAVPLVIVGFITPAIARLGQNASKMLLTAVAIAYLSSVGAAAFSAASGYAIIPHLSVPTEVSGLVDLPKPSFVLDIPPLMSGVYNVRAVHTCRIQRAGHGAAARARRELDQGRDHQQGVGRA